MIPGINRFAGYNISAPGANTDIMTNDITPGPGSVLRVTVVLETSSVFNAAVTDGSTAETWGINSSAALNANDMYTFEIPTSPSLAYNFQVETDGVIGQLIVQEILGAG